MRDSRRAAVVIPLTSFAVSAFIFIAVFIPLRAAADRHETPTAGAEGVTFGQWVILAIHLGLGVYLVRGIGWTTKTRTFLWLLPLWYYPAASLAAAVGGGIAANKADFLIGIAFAAGAWLLAVTAHWVVGAWDKHPESRSDIAAFLLTTHTLAFIVLSALYALGNEGGGSLWQGVFTSGVFALTVLAAPVCAGIWALIRSRAKLTAADPPPVGPTLAPAGRSPAGHERRGELAEPSVGVRSLVIGLWLAAVLLCWRRVPRS